MSKRPWFKFYATDWRSDAKLRLCSLAARGLWVEVMALSHDEGYPYGYLLLNGKAPTVDQVAMLVGRPTDEVRVAYDELVAAGVPSVDDKRKCLYSRRMVRDERAREEGSKYGKKGGNPTLMGGVKGVDNTPPDSDSDSNKKKKEVTEAINKVFAAHLRAREIYFTSKNGKQPASMPDLTPKLRKAIAEAIRQHGFEKAEAAGRGIFLSDFHTGTNDRNKEYLQPELCWRISRDVNNVERFSELVIERRRASNARK